jgi:hypothetical protein
MFLPHGSLRNLVLSLAALIGGPWDLVLPIVDFATEGHSADGALVGFSHIIPSQDLLSRQQVEPARAPDESRLAEDLDDDDLDDDEILISAHPGALRRGATCPAGSLSPASSEAARSAPLLLLTGRFRC